FRCHGYLRELHNKAHSFPTRRSSDLVRPDQVTRLELGDEQPRFRGDPPDRRSEAHTSELQSRLVISYAVSCLKQKTRLNSIHAFLFRMPSYDKKKKNNTH